jgi:predicted RecA/RadA family phage recombinase
MATNIVFEDGDQLDLVCSQPTTPASGDPVLVGQIPGVALTKERADGKTTVKLNGVANLSVKGEGAAGNAAVAVGDILYYEAGQTPPVNKDATNGVRFGYALGAVASGATATIPVKIGY